MTKQASRALDGFAPKFVFDALEDEHPERILVDWFERDFF